VSIQHLAMVQGAVYDAVNMIDGGHEPYLDDLPAAPESASKAAAVATAAHDVLVGVVVVPPLSQAILDRLDDLRDDSIAATVQDGAPAVAAGIAAGAAAAEAMLDDRANDGRYGSFTFTEGTEPGEWRRTRRRRRSSTRSPGWHASTHSCSRARRSSGRKGRTRSRPASTRRNTTR
jgi:hypothetical protein